MLEWVYARLADHERLQTGFTLYLSSLEQFLKADTVLILQKRKLKTPWLNPESPRELEMTLELKPVIFRLPFPYFSLPGQVSPEKDFSPPTC